MRVTFGKHEVPATGTIVALVGEEGDLGHCAQRLDKLTGGAIARALRVGPFKGKADESLTLLAPQGISAGRILLAGIGKPEKFDILAAQALAGRVVSALQGTGEKELAIWIEKFRGCSLSEASFAASFAAAVSLRIHRFDKYKTKEKPEHKPSLKHLACLVADPAAARSHFSSQEKIAESVKFARDLVSEPANILYPAAMAAQARALASLGLKVEILGEKEMKRLGMGALLGVGQGSERESQLVTLHWQGNKGRSAAKESPIAFVGKGVTFDTGGISLKPAQGMEEMKMDMAGAACVLGLMRALALRKAKVNAVGVIGLVENMPSGSAQRPGDIVTSMSGQTIEVLNTDAEGRLVLADALWYAQEKFKPGTIIDLATLTGAVLVALGTLHAGLFSNNDDLADKLLKSGKTTGELLWRLPLAPAYNKLIDSPIADMKNISANRYAGSIIGGEFLQRFIQKNVHWAHLDIAGVAWTDKNWSLGSQGSTGFGVRLLDDFVAKNFEAK